MVYCHGCGAEIHNSAPTCPHCGAPQRSSATASQGADSSSGTSLAQVASFIIACVTFLATLDDSPWDEDMLIGFWFLELIAVVCALVGLAESSKTKGFGVAGLILAALAAFTLTP